MANDLAPLPTPAPVRDPGRRGRPYRPEVVEDVRALLGTELRFDEIAARTGVGEATVGRWSRRFRFAAGEVGAAAVNPELAGGENPGSTTGLRSLAVGSGSPLSDDRKDEEGFAPRPAGRGPRPLRHPPQTREAARALVEGTRLGLERIALELGIGTATLSRWVRGGRWARPAGAGHARPARYRVPRGRPYAADAVGTARDLVTGTLLSQKRIAAQAGVSQATISIWIKERGWVRPATKSWSRRFAPRSGGRRSPPPEVAAADPTRPRSLRRRGGGTSRRNYRPSSSPRGFA